MGSGLVLTCASPFFLLKEMPVSKRSRSVSLVLMSLAPVMLAACSQPTPPSPSTPPKPKGPTAYETVNNCVFDGNAREVCENGYQTARAEALAAAPRFATGEECALEFENCQAVPPAAPAVAAAPGAGTASAPAAASQSSGSSFMPMMAGFMIGQALGNSSAGGGAVGAGFDGRRDDRRSSGSSVAASSVLYRARGGQLSQVHSLSGGGRSVEPVKARTVTSANVAATKAAQAKAAQARAAQAKAASSSRSVSRSGFGGRSGGFGG